MKRRAFVALAGAGIACEVLLTMVFFPVPQLFAFHDAAIYDPNDTCAPDIEATAGSTVSFQWSAPAPTGFWVVKCPEGPVVYYAYGTGGSDKFVSTGGVYQFGSSCPMECVPANVDGSFVGPVLPL
jgi:hypothetical protein